MCVDSGGARSMVQTEFGQQLQKSDKTRSGIIERFEVEDPISCTGVCKGMVSQDITKVSVVSLWLDPVSEDGGQAPEPASFDVQFAELPGAADALLLGFPDMLRWDVVPWRDDDGNMWVRFGKLDVSVLAERQDGGS